MRYRFYTKLMLPMKTTKPPARKKGTACDVVGAFIKDDKNRLLLCKRKEHDQFGSLWEFPGGGVELNEHKLDALKRGMKGELSVEVRIGKLINRFQDEIPGLKIYVYLYECSIVTGTPKCLDCQDLKWVSLDEAKKLPLAPTDKKIMGYVERRKLV